MGMLIRRHRERWSKAEEAEQAPVVEAPVESKPEPQEEPAAEEGKKSRKKGS